MWRSLEATFSPFNSYCGVTQGDPSPPTIFNVVVDAVIRHCVKAVAMTEARSEGLGETIQELVDFFYADDGIVVSPRLEILQMAFNVLTDLFCWVSLHTNVRKTVSMDFRPC